MGHKKSGFKKHKREQIVNPIARVNWIPWSIFQDCIDNPNHHSTTTNVFGISVPEAPGITENVQGYSIADCYEAITLNNPTTFNDVEQNLSNNLPAGQNLIDLQDLFADYGY